MKWKMKFQACAKLTCVRGSTLALLLTKRKKTCGCLCEQMVAPQSAPWAAQHLCPNDYCF